MAIETAKPYRIQHNYCLICDHMWTSYERPKRCPNCVKQEKAAIRKIMSDCTKQLDALSDD